MILPKLVFGLFCFFSFLGGGEEDVRGTLQSLLWCQDFSFKATLRTSGIPIESDHPSVPLLNI